MQDPGNVQKSTLLVTAMRDVPSSRGPMYVGPVEMRERAAVLMEGIPFPPGRNSAAGYAWSGIEGGLFDADIRNLVQYRASCDWFRHVLDHGALGEEERTILAQIPQWLVFRDAPFRTVVESLIAEAFAGNFTPMRQHVERACALVPRP
jgi:hypothetical protein